MDARVDETDQPKLATIGYIAPVRQPFAWLPAALVLVSVVAVVIACMLAMLEVFFVAMLLGSLLLMFVMPTLVPRPRFRWVNPDGSNSHEFVSHTPPKSPWSLLDQSRLDGDFRNEIISDPNLGNLKTLYTPKTWVAKLLGQKVFEVRRIRGRRRLEAVAANPELAGVRFEVVADPRLHPDTIERLVEKFATGQDQRQVYGYVLARGSG